MSRRRPVEALRKEMGFTREEVAAMARWSPARQRALEEGAELLAEEADRLTALLGTDIEALLEGDVQPRPLARLLKAQAADLDAQTRFALAEAMTVGREIQELRRLLGLPHGLSPLSAFQANGDYGHPQHGMPERLAGAVRGALKLAPGPVASISRDLLEPLGIVTLWVPMQETVDAVAMASEEVGAVIVANPRGAHTQTPYGRRITFAHELCHILFDRPEMRRFARACAIEGEPRGQQREWFERVERRARAFALALLAPSAALHAFWEQHSGVAPADRINLVMDYFGIGYTATRSHLHNQGLHRLTYDAGRRNATISERWRAADPSPPTPASSWLRAGALGELAQQAVSQGLMSPRRAAELQHGPLALPQAWRSNDATARGYLSSSMVVEERA